MAYTTDLTLAQFEVLNKLLPQSKTKTGFISKHLFVNGILYQLKNGCQWRDLPTDFPKWQTVYSQFRRWRIDGTWEEVLQVLANCRWHALEKKSEYPSLLLGDSMCAKNTDTANIAHQRLLSLQINQWHQKTFIGGCFGQSVFCQMHGGKYK